MKTSAAALVMASVVMLASCFGTERRAEWARIPRRIHLPADPRKAALPYPQAQNLVDWYPWGDEAFAEARNENKAIFLSVGYSTCRWCHVMEREPFENPVIAKLLNDHFVSIKVDREERPLAGELLAIIDVAYVPTLSRTLHW